MDVDDLRLNDEAEVLYAQAKQAYQDGDDLTGARLVVAGGLAYSSWAKSREGRAWRAYRRKVLAAEKALSKARHVSVSAPHFEATLSIEDDGDGREQTVAVPPMLAGARRWSWAEFVDYAAIQGWSITPLFNTELRL